MPWQVLSRLSRRRPRAHPFKPRGPLRTVDSLDGDRGADDPRTSVEQKPKPQARTTVHTPHTPLQVTRTNKPNKKTNLPPPNAREGTAHGEGVAHTVVCSLSLQHPLHRPTATHSTRTSHVALQRTDTHAVKNSTAAGHPLPLTDSLDDDTSTSRASPPLMQSPLSLPHAVYGAASRRSPRARRSSAGHGSTGMSRPSPHCACSSGLLPSPP